MKPKFGKQEYGFHFIPLKSLSFKAHSRFKVFTGLTLQFANIAKSASLQKLSNLTFHIPFTLHYISAPHLQHTTSALIGIV
jgi:hypothetical protein